MGLEMEKTSVEGGGCALAENGLIGADLLMVQTSMRSFCFRKGTLIENSGTSSSVCIAYRPITSAYK